MAKRHKSRKIARRTNSTPSQQMLEAMNEIWLAGVGALSKARQGAPQILHQLAAEGLRIQARSRGSAEKAMEGLLSGVRSTIDSGVSQVRGQAGEALDNLETIFQTRVRRALIQLGVPSAEDVEILTQRVEQLTDSIANLTRSRTPAKRRRPPTARKSKRSAQANAA